jgi:hypothetical protein
MLPNSSRSMFGRSPIGSSVVLMKKWLTNLSNGRGSAKLSQEDSDSLSTGINRSNHHLDRSSRSSSFAAISLMDVLTQKLGSALNRETDIEDEETSSNLDTPAWEPISPDLQSLADAARPRLIAVDGESVEAGEKATKYHDSIQEQIEESLNASIREKVEVLPSTSPISGSGDDLAKLALMSPASITETLCDLFLEIFELKEKNNWLRRQAVMIILQQVFGMSLSTNHCTNLHVSLP